MVPAASKQDCPICHEDSKRLFAIDGYEIKECLACGHQFVAGHFGAAHAVRVYDDNYFSGGGAGYPDYTRLADAVEELARYYLTILSEHMPKGRVLDVGAAAGFMLKTFISDGWTGQGLEPNPLMAQYGRERFNVHTICGTLEEFQSGEKFDLILISQVIGHFYDLQKAISNVSGLTPAEGFCLIDYWDRQSLVARLLAKNWHEYSPPSVLHWFSQKDLDLLMDRHGFRRVSEGVPAKYIMGAHIRSLLEYKLGSTTWTKPLKVALHAIPDRLKLRYPALDLRWALYRYVRR